MPDSRKDIATSAIIGWRLIRATLGPGKPGGNIAKILAVACIQMQVWY